MKECPRCHKDLADDSEFCMYCGRNLAITDIGPEEPVSRWKPNPRKNNLGRYAILLFILTIVIFDFVLGTIFAQIGWNYKIVFWISFVLYLLVIFLAGFSIYVDHVDEKNGLEPSNNIGFAISAITFSIVVILMNLQSVLLK